MNYDFNYTQEMQERMERINKEIDMSFQFKNRNERILVKKDDVIWQVDTLKLMDIDVESLIQNN